jgi:hypothetical protein
VFKRALWHRIVFSAPRNQDRGKQHNVDFPAQRTKTADPTAVKREECGSQTMLPLRALLRRRRPLLPSAAAGFFTSSGSDAIARPPPPPPPRPTLPPEGPSKEGGSLAQQVERAASVCAAMRGWMADGRAVHRGHVFHAVNRLRRHRLHRTALQVPSLPLSSCPFWCCNLLDLDSLGLQRISHSD